jgi:hypothetical protein
MRAEENKYSHFRMQYLMRAGYILCISSGARCGDAVGNRFFLFSVSLLPAPPSLEGGGSQKPIVARAHKLWHSALDQERQLGLLRRTGCRSIQYRARGGEVLTKTPKTKNSFAIFSSALIWYVPKNKPHLRYIPAINALFVIFFSSLCFVPRSKKRLG